jgi:adenylate kinase family enzyme
MERDFVSTMKERNLLFLCYFKLLSMNFPKRIMIFGRPGSGKSTFACELHRKTQIPVFYGDKYFFEANWKMKSPEKCFQIQQSFIHQPYWIIDGNCISCPDTFEQRFASADLIVYFNFSRYLCLYRILKRRFFRNKKFDDRAEGCRESISWGLLKFAWNCELQFAPLIQRLKKQYPSKIFVEIKKIKNLNDLIASFS